MVIASICDVDAFVAHESEKDNILYVEIDNVYGSRNKNAYLIIKKHILILSFFMI